MTRRVFFSFHYEGDAWRAGQVRNSWVVKQDHESAGFVDAAAWEVVKKKGKESIEKWINDQLNGTSVTVVLIGAETANREYVGYEIVQSHKKGNGMLGIYIHNMKDSNSLTSAAGKNPFANWQTTENGKTTNLGDIYPTYDWVNDSGRENIEKWIEAAAKKAGR